MPRPESYARRPPHRHISEFRFFVDGVAATQIVIPREAPSRSLTRAGCVVPTEESSRRSWWLAHRAETQPTTFTDATGARPWRASHRCVGRGTSTGKQIPRSAPGDPARGEIVQASTRVSAIVVEHRPGHPSLTRRSTSTTIDPPVNAARPRGRATRPLSTIRTTAARCNHPPRTTKSFTTTSSIRTRCRSSWSTWRAWGRSGPVCRGGRWRCARCCTWCGCSA
jgi:hypothetical protein